MIKNPRRISNYVTAVVLAAGASAIVLFGRNIVGADVVLPGFATAHIHMEITVCEKSKIPVKAVFTPPQDKNYYFKERTFEVAPGLNTIEWYVRKIPGGEFSAGVFSSSGIFSPDSNDIVLTNDKSSDIGTYSLIVCQGAAASQATATPSQDEPTGDISTNQTQESATPLLVASVSATQTVPGIPVPDSSGVDELSSPV